MFKYIFILILMVSIHSNSQELEWVIPGAGGSDVYPLSNINSNYIGIVDSKGAVTIKNIDDNKFYRIDAFSFKDGLYFKPEKGDRYDQLYITGDNKLLASNFGLIKQYDLETKKFSNKEYEAIGYQYFDQLNLYLNQDQTQLYTWNDNQLWVFDYNTTNLQKFYNFPSSPYLQALHIFEFKGRDFVFFYEYSSDLKQINVKTSSLENLNQINDLHTFNHEGFINIRDVKYHEQTNSLYVIEERGSLGVNVFSLIKYQEGEKVLIEDDIENNVIEFSKDNSLLTYSKDKSLVLYDITNSNVVKKIKFKDDALNSFFITENILTIIFRSGLSFDYDISSNSIQNTHFLGNGLVRNIQESKNKKYVYISTIQPLEGYLINEYIRRTYVVDNSNGNIINYVNSPLQDRDIYRCFNILEDNNENILIASLDGIYSWDWKQDLFTRIHNSQSNLQNIVFDESKMKLYILLDDKEVQIMDYVSYSIIDSFSTIDVPFDANVIENILYVIEGKSKDELSLTSYNLSQSEFENVCIKKVETTGVVRTSSYDFQNQNIIIGFPPKDYFDPPRFQSLLDCKWINKNFNFKRPEDEYGSHFPSNISIAKNTGLCAVSYSTSMLDNTLTLWDLDQGNQVYYFNKLGDEIRFVGNNSLSSIFLTDDAKSLFYGSTFCSLGKIKNTPTSVENTIISEDKIIVYPNPADDFVEFNLSDQNIIPTKFEIINTFGTLIMEGVILNNNYQIDISALSKGAYIIKFKLSNNQYKFTKFLKN
jgi:hypothetical protein